MIPEHEQEWIKNIVTTETELILKKLNIDNPEKLLEILSHRIVQKVIHPLTVYLNECEISDYNAEKSKTEYMENYFNKFNRPADHID